MKEIRLEQGDARDVLTTLADASIDSIVTDPPYALVSIVKRFGGENAAPARDGDVYARASAGFMGKQWDTGETAFAVEFWAECLRVLKPGGHVAAFSGTRTYHRLAVAIEDAGFEIRDQLAWVYATGFPKSHDVSKGIDKALGAVREILEERRAFGIGGNGCLGGHAEGATMKIDAGAATPAAAQWQGWGTALKPAWEPIVLARKPMDGTVAANVLAHGTGAINVDGCRIATAELTPRNNSNTPTLLEKGFDGKAKLIEPSPLGRWPANFIHDGSDEVTTLFPQCKSTIGKPRSASAGIGYGMTHTGAEYADEGSAARFFYSAKADKLDRWGSKHPTVKPVDLMRWLCRLVTPPGGTVLDPFAGSGSTGVAAFAEGFDSILVEREAEYAADIRARIEHVKGEGVHSSTRMQAKKADKSAGPLFREASA